jgi:hypothetical protein
LCRTLVSPSNPGQISAACQVACRQSGVLQRLEDILLASGIPADVLTETINTLGRGQHTSALVLPQSIDVEHLTIDNLS